MNVPIIYGCMLFIAGDLLVGVQVFRLTGGQAVKAQVVVAAKAVNVVHRGGSQTKDLNGQLD